MIKCKCEIISKLWPNITCLVMMTIKNYLLYDYMILVRFSVGIIRRKYRICVYSGIETYSNNRMQSLPGKHQYHYKNSKKMIC